MNTQSEISTVRFSFPVLYFLFFSLPISFFLFGALIILLFLFVALLNPFHSFVVEISTVRERDAQRAKRAEAESGGDDEAGRAEVLSLSMGSSMRLQTQQLTVLVCLKASSPSPSPPPLNTIQDAAADRSRLPP